MGCATSTAMPTDVSLATLNEHTQEVKSVACFVLGDGSTRAVSASADNMLKIWDLSEYGCLATLQGHVDQVQAVAHFSHQGRPHAISGSVDGSLRVWDLSPLVETEVNHTWCLAKLSGHTWMVEGVACFHDEDHSPRACSVSRDRSLRVWDPLAGSSLRIITDTDHLLDVACFSVDGAPRAITASLDGSLTVWDPHAGKRIIQLTGHVHDVYCVACFSLADGSPRAVSGGRDCSLRLWDPLAGTCLATMFGHSGWVKGVSSFSSSEGPRIVSASIDGSLRVWNAAEGRCLASLRGHTRAGVKAVACFVLSDGSPRCVSAGADKTLRVWDPRVN